MPNIHLDDEELRVLLIAIDDQVDTSQAYQEHLETDGQCLLFGEAQEASRVDAIVEEEVLKRVLTKLRGGVK